MIDQYVISSKLKASFKKKKGKEIVFSSAHVHVKRMQQGKIFSLGYHTFC